MSLRWMLLAALLLAFDAMAQAKVDTVQSLAMPSGADYGRLRLLKEGRMTKVYVDMLRFDDSAGSKPHFPAEMARLVDISPSGLTRLFTDTILKSRRFEVYDLRSTVTAEHADIVIDAQIISATQEFKPLEGGMQAAFTGVLLSVQMKDVYTGKYLFGTAVQVEGKTGLVSGDRTVLAPGESPGDPAIRNRLAVDYQYALRRAFVLAGQRIESILRPQATVLAIDGADVGIVGGQAQGFQADDEFVVFRPKVVKLGDREVFASTKPVALIHCASVATDTSQCNVISKVADLQMQEGDFAIITDGSLRKTRWE
ncbi:MAG: hypothetical protein JO006_15640 [Paucibacter sp.]|nr:hypothetical protein [Roseateles sp.]